MLGKLANRKMKKRSYIFLTVTKTLFLNYFEYPLVAKNYFNPTWPGLFEVLKKPGRNKMAKKIFSGGHVSRDDVTSKF